ncbi:MAG: hypothetical protein IT443_02595 [Phycisphaeraceae bacterium]|nr:hypothetical protein [Phycisphaeraceae bacterium]
MSLDLHSVQTKCRQAREGLWQNSQGVLGYDQPVLWEGGVYGGIWLECGPHEASIFAGHDPKAIPIAIASHRVFYHHQREDGQFPCWIKTDQMAYSQIQMVVPIASTALDVYQLSGDRQFLIDSYAACARWDDWLAKYRNTRGTGLCECFVEYDTGHDNSPRFAHGMLRECPGGDARNCPTGFNLPWLSPDLSATVYGGRVALAKMAELLSKPQEAKQWRDRAEAIQKAIMAHCYDPASECFYDRDMTGQFVRVRGDAMLRVLMEHVVDQPTFDRIAKRHLFNPEAFWTPYPFPSIAADDPTFVRALPGNSWGGASQALAALRAPRWLPHYGCQKQLEHLMRPWVQSLVRAKAFMQQLNPWTGEPLFSEGYSPAMLVMIDFAARLGFGA